jgi:hypothetical protein
MKWITRKNVGIDRVACSWLIKKYIDIDAVFEFIEFGEEIVPVLVVKFTIISSFN